MKVVSKACCPLTLRYCDTVSFVCRVLGDRCTAEVVVEYGVEPGDPLPDFMWLRSVIRDAARGKVLAKELACRIYEALKNHIRVKKVTVRVHSEAHGPVEIVVEPR